MAIACKCDRCGCLYERYNMSTIGNTTPSSFNGIRFVRKRLEEPYLCTNIMDLCPDCMAELRDWFAMETRKEDDVNGQTDS